MWPYVSRGSGASTLHLGIIISFARPNTFHRCHIDTVREGMRVRLLAGITETLSDALIDANQSDKLKSEPKQ